MRDVKRCMEMVAMVSWAAVAALIVLSGCTTASSRLDRSNLLIGAFCYREAGLDEAHVKAVAECGVDVLLGVGIKKENERSALNLFSKHGVGVFARNVPCYWFGGNGKDAGKMAEKFPQEKIERQIEEFSESHDHPAICGLYFCDEPSAKDMPYIGKVCKMVSAGVPEMLPVVNLYPNYAVASQNTGMDERSQLGAPNYRAYIDTYCKTVPLDYISYDFYVYTPNRQRRSRLVRQMYDNFNIVAEACRRTGRSLWYAPQVNSRSDKSGAYEPTTVNRLRFQAFTAMAYGAEMINWACWFPGWWTNNVYTAAGDKTEQYDRLKKVNAELRRLGPVYMQFRNVATHFVGFPHDYELDKIGQDVLQALNAAPFEDVRTSEGSPLLVGEMIPRGREDGRRALFVVASGDMFDYFPATRMVTFRLRGGDRVRILGPDGEIVPARATDGTYAFSLAENAAALLIAESSNKKE